MTDWAWKQLESVLDWLAAAADPLARLLVSILETVRPKWAAVVRNRQGRLHDAALLLGYRRDTRVGRRVADAIDVLENGYPIPTSGSGPRRVWNGRVLQVFHSSTTYDQNGYSVRSEHLLQSIRREGIEPVCVTRLGYPGDIKRHGRYQGVATSSSDVARYLHLPDPQTRIGDSETAYAAAYGDALTRLAQQNDVSVIHAHSNYLNGLASVHAARATGIPIIYELRGLWHVTRASRQRGYADSEHYRYSDAMELAAAQGADLVVTLSETMKRWLIRRGVPAERIRVVANAAEQIEPVKPYAHDGFTIGYIGSVVGYEGLDTLVESAEMLADQGVAVRITIVGGGASMDGLRARVRTSSVRDAIVLTGPVDRTEVRSFYAGFDVCVVPRKPTAVTNLVPPLKPLEVMSHGVPLVVSDLPPLAEQVVHGQTGLVFEAGNPADLCQQLRVLHDDRALARDLVTNGLRMAAANTWQSRGRQLLTIYRELASPG